MLAALKTYLAAALGPLSPAYWAATVSLVPRSALPTTIPGPQTARVTTASGDADPDADPVESRERGQLVGRAPRIPPHARFLPTPVIGDTGRRRDDDTFFVLF